MALLCEDTRLVGRVIVATRKDRLSQSQVSLDELDELARSSGVPVHCLDNTSAQVASEWVPPLGDAVAVEPILNVLAGQCASLRRPQ